MAEDVRFYGQWMRAEAETRIGHLYPKARLPDGTEATVIAWLWARTVRSPDPAARGAMVPLISSFLISQKEGKNAWIEPVIDPTAPDGYRFEVKTGTLSQADEEQLKKGMKSARGNFICLVTGSPISEDWNRTEGKVKRLGVRLMAIVAEGRRTRIYLSPTRDHEVVAINAKPAWEPEGELYEKALGFRVPAYGLTRWADLFTSRQLAALTTFSDLVTEARGRVLDDARMADLPYDPTPIHEGGNGVAAYADAVATYLALAVSRLTDIQNSLCTWELSKTQVRHLFGRQAIPMVWDFAENNTFNDAAGDFVTSLDNLVKAMSCASTAGTGAIAAIDASRNSFPIRPIVISTDPPYYDNIGYADLSDFFYVWLRHSLGGVWPDLFRRLTTPKAEELVATPYRHGGKVKAEAFFMKGMSEALRAMREAATEGEPLTIYYAFKQAELAEEGIISAGWASFLQAVVGAGLVVDGTWPMRTELSNRMRGQESNALASSIVLVCRNRDPSAATVKHDTFVRALRRELPNALARIRAGGVGPVDMAQAAIGPGMGVFTGYAAVLEDSGEPMKVRTALALINQARDEIDTEDDASYDLETRFALDWFSEAGWEAVESGRAILAANARNLSLDGLIHTGLITTQVGKTRLIRRDEIPVSYDDPAFDKASVVWKAAQHLVRALTAEDGGQDKAAKIMAHVTGRETIRALAFRLYGLCERKNWSAEALVWNRLAEEWRAIEDRAATMPRAAGMPDLFEATG